MRRGDEEEQINGEEREKGGIDAMAMVWRSN